MVQMPLNVKITLIGSIKYDRGWSGGRWNWTESLVLCLFSARCTGCGLLKMFEEDSLGDVRKGVKKYDLSLLPRWCSALKQTEKENYGDNSTNEGYLKMAVFFARL